MKKGDQSAHRGTWENQKEQNGKKKKTFLKNQNYNAYSERHDWGHHL